MKVQIVETKESDGDWIRIKIDDSTKAILKLNGTKSREEVLARAEEIAQFFWENGSPEKVLKEFSTKTV